MTTFLCANIAKVLDFIISNFLSEKYFRDNQNNHHCSRYEKERAERIILRRNLTYIIEMNLTNICFKIIADVKSTTLQM
jgi:hypothetical protein